MLKYLQVLGFATHSNLLMHLIINTFLYECAWKAYGCILLFKWFMFNWPACAKQEVMERERVFDFNVYN